MMMRKAFTLVELLIVITLIAILSVAVLATINPIEQTNKARDSQFKNDAAEVLGAYERYFASQNMYPWNAGTLGVQQGTPIAAEGQTWNFGVLGTGGVGDTNSELINTSEIKGSFANKTPFTATAKAIDRLYMYHNGNDVNYVCFIPKAKANRTGAQGEKLKCLNTEATPPSLNSIGGDCVAVDNWTENESLQPGPGRANMMCVPE
jgi:prepilin-type N-terminal cleavage/methylation domain-containing protein